MTQPRYRQLPAVTAVALTVLGAAACGGNPGATAVVDTTGSSIVNGRGDTTSVANAGSSNYLGDYILQDAEFGTQTEVTVAGDTRTIHTNALPNHATGDFPNDGNPNFISAQDLTWRFPVKPTWVGHALPVGIPGVAVNGVKFEPGTAESVTCETGENYRVEGLQDTYSLGMDFNLAHVQPTGEYHYHGVSQLLVDAYANDADLVHVGFAADGYLVYYSKSGAYTSGYALTTEPRTGSGCIGSRALRNADIEIDGTTPDGTYSSDWEYSFENGNLDSCNGTEIDGAYAYLITDEYPFISRCLNGDPSADARVGAAPNGGVDAAPDGPPPGGPAPGGTVPAGGRAGQGPDLTEAAAALGVTVEELETALGPPPPDLEAAAATLGVTLEELRAALPRPVLR